MCVAATRGGKLMGEIVFESVFADEFRNLVDVKRAMGFDYMSTELSLRRLDRFFIETGVSEKKLTKSVCEQWCRKRSYETQKNQGKRISSLRVFAKYLVDIGIEAYVPPKGLTKHGPKYDAHIYTDDELSRFFAAVDESKSIPRECPYRAQVMPIFFRILYTSGMRVSELRLLKIRDFNLEKGFITVREGKNHKDRIVPVHATLVEKCRKLKTAIHRNSNDDEYFFMQLPGRPMPLVNVYKNFRRYLEKAGIPHTGKGPRIHDFRHTFCVNLLRKWIEEEKNLMACMPYMKTILGHESFDETAYYLKLTSELHPYLKDMLKKKFPSVIEEVLIDECEFY